MVCGEGGREREKWREGGEGRREEGKGVSDKKSHSKDQTLSAGARVDGAGHETKSDQRWPESGLIVGVFLCEH